MWPLDTVAFAAKRGSMSSTMRIPKSATPTAAAVGPYVRTAGRSSGRRCRFLDLAASRALSPRIVRRCWSPDTNIRDTMSTTRTATSRPVGFALLSPANILITPMTMKSTNAIRTPRAEGSVR
ncbi:Uncharacterised protein [Mycobacteroides abscessus subsp. abscessus]|nr:Uncharacterised protein [Mycobacteroides abscessus subsp. abscessus]